MSDQHTIREIADRMAIHDCLVRYCRGLDRLDRALVASAYHADAIEHHGQFVGPVDRYLDWVMPIQERYFQRTQHFITNVTYDIEGDTAHVECYYLRRTLARGSTPGGTLYGTMTGRYVDRFERRDGRWAIAARACLVDIRDEASDPEGTRGDADHEPSTRDRSDTSYRRPLAYDASSFTA